jgi:Mg2+ and Co2+ transporter CorA
MATVNDLLAKAMSTSSEDEAIACLRMARKRGGTPSKTADTSSTIHENMKEYHDTIKQAHQEISLLRAQANLTHERYRALHKQYLNLSTKYHQSRSTSMALLLVGIIGIMLSTLL